jgi:hypothetical protein
MSIDMLPDDVLLEIFDFFQKEENEIDERIEGWQSLVHVCQRWRSLVFGSPRRLNLRLFCSDKTPARDTLDVWPALPLFIRCNRSYFTTKSIDNIVAVLKRSHRVRYINLINLKGSDLQKLSAAMQEPFPELTDLELWSDDKMVSVLPDSFLGGSAPRLELLSLHNIPFPGLPKLLLSAAHLRTLELRSIPHSGYFSPEAIVTSLSTLTRLTTLWLLFESPPSRPDQARERLPPLTRSVLPVLTFLEFKGVSEYLEVVVARIDSPQLDTLRITFFNDIVFDTSQLAQFIRRTPILKALTKAHVTFEGGEVSVDLPSRTSRYEGLNVRILCIELDWQVSSMEQVCSSCLTPISMLDDLYIKILHPNPNWQDNTENAQWLELLHPFTAAKNLYLSEEIARRIVPALEELVGARATEVLPSLKNIFLEGQPSGPIQEDIQQFVATRQVSGHPVAVSYGQKVGE